MTDPGRAGSLAVVQVDEAGTQALGRALARVMAPPAFVALHGPLGAGKSVLARALARELGVVGTIASPTYPLLLRHPGRDGIEVVHLDLYRLEDPDQIWELGWEELPDTHEVVIVEWAERAGSELPDDRLELRLAPVPGAPGLREIRISGATGGATGHTLREAAGSLEEVK